MTVRIINADVMDGLKQLPDESVHCVTTSPPYWGLRDYGSQGQIGLEPSVYEWLERMVEVFIEVRRVLRTDGTCWVNIGDSYNSGNSGSLKGSTLTGGQRNQASSNRNGRKPVQGLKVKDRIMQPARLALALQDDGWWLRSEIVWSKPNPMPEGVSDRPTSAHEMIYLVTKSSRYFYDADAIRTPLAPKTFTTFGTEHRAQGNDALGGVKADNWGKSLVKRKPKVKVPTGWDRGSGAHGTIHRNGRSEAEYQDVELAGANARDVWEIASESFPDAHFATFPTELARRCIAAGCPAGGTVLDPFGGAGTTGLVADRLQRDAILIELNPTYAAMAERRIKGDRGDLLELMEAAQ